MSDTHPHASSYLDRHSKRRWRFRRAGKTIQLPGEPGAPEFEAAYRAAIEGRSKSAQPASQRSLRAAWVILTTKTPEWKALEPTSQRQQTRIAEAFLRMPVAPGMTMGDVAMADLERRHVKMILAARSETPHAAEHLLRLIRKLTGIGLDQEWITVDPCYRVRLRPEMQGWKAWKDESLAAFERRWPLGSTPRIAYALARYFGHRRSDVALVRWDDLQNVVQAKTGKALWLPMHPALQAALEATKRRGEYVLMTSRGEPFTAGGLGSQFRNWVLAAGLPKGHSLHGLRKHLGKDLAESGATAKEIMAMLGHETMQQASLYTKEAEQRRLASEGMKKLLANRNG
jgi:hypothetical protein